MERDRKREREVQPRVPLGARVYAVFLGVQEVRELFVMDLCQPCLGQTPTFFVFCVASRSSSLRNLDPIQAHNAVHWQTSIHIDP